MSCGVGHRRHSDPALLWLWCRLAATASIRPLAWEPPCAAGVALEKAKRPPPQKKKLPLLTALALEKFLDRRKSNSRSLTSPHRQTVWTLFQALFHLTSPQVGPPNFLTSGNVLLLWPLGYPTTMSLLPFPCPLPRSFTNSLLPFP